MDKNDMLFAALQSGGAVVPLEVDGDGNPTDPEGFVRSLAEALNSIPPVWVRLKHDPEWTTRHWLGVNQVVGCMLLGVMNATGTYTDGRTGAPGEDQIPENLTGLARFLQFELRRHFKADCAGCSGVFETNICELGAFLWERVQEGNWFTDQTGDQEVAVHNGLIALRNQLRQEAQFEARFAANMAAEARESLEDGAGI